MPLVSQNMVNCYVYQGFVDYEQVCCEQVCFDDNQVLIIIHVHFQLQSLEFVNKRVVDYDHVCCEHVVCEHVCCVQVCFDDSQVLIIIHVHFQLQSLEFVNERVVDFGIYKKI